jgi:hypothetical protein
MTAPTSESVSSRKGRWHQSTVSTLLDGCEWQYLLEYELQLPAPESPATAAGTAYHAGLEAHAESLKAGGPGLSETEMREVAHAALDEQAALIEVWIGSSPEGIRAELDALISNAFHAKDKASGLTLIQWLGGFEVIAVEPEFTIPVVEGAMPVGGWIDLVLRDKATGRIVVADHKSARSFGPWSVKATADEHWSQPAMYLAAMVLGLGEQLGLPGLELEDLDFAFLVCRKQLGKTKAFEGFRIVPFEVEVSHIARLGSRIRQAQAKADAGFFLRNPAYRFCDARWCSFYDLCVGSGRTTGEIFADALKRSQKADPDPSQESS